LRDSDLLRKVFDATVQRCMSGGLAGDEGFPSRMRNQSHISTRQYGRIVHGCRGGKDFSLSVPALLRWPRWKF